jgi:glutaredoxin-related protein
MPKENDFKVIYRTDDLPEYRKYSVYTQLLELNKNFKEDVNSLRERFGIVVLEEKMSLGDINEVYHDVLNNDDFMDSIRVMAKRITIQGDWVDGLAEYVCGADAQASLYPNVDLHRVEARAVTDSDEPHVELKIYGDIPQQDLEKIVSKRIRLFINKRMGYQSIKGLNDKTFRKIKTIHHYADTHSMKEISEILYDLKYPKQDYGSIRRQYQEYMKYADRFYQR